ncbi:MAG: 4-alpha-glucanotransferase, partial [Lysobacteraceae bacterium]
FAFPGMKILQFGFGTDGTDDFLPHNWGRNFVAYTGTHDNDTVRGWWNSATPRERQFAGSYLPANDHDIHWAMIRACANSVANFAVFPLQDVLGLDASHRMNIPGTMGDHNWTWRFTWPMVHDEAKRVLGLITATSGRGPWGLSGVD